MQSVYAVRERKHETNETRWATGLFKYRTNMDKHQQQQQTGGQVWAATDTLPPSRVTVPWARAQDWPGRRPRLVRWSEGHAYSLGPNGPQGSAHNTYDKGG